MDTSDNPTPPSSTKAGRNGKRINYYTTREKRRNTVLRTAARRLNIPRELMEELTNKPK